MKLAVGAGDAEVVAQHLQRSAERDAARVRGCMSLPDLDSPRASALEELEAEPALAGAGGCDDGQDLPPPCQRAVEGVLEDRQLVLTADEPRQAAHPRDIELGLQFFVARQLEDSKRAIRSLHVRGALLG